jgi:hypothetical protein
VRQLRRRLLKSPPQFELKSPGEGIGRTPCVGEALQKWRRRATYGGSVELVIMTERMSGVPLIMHHSIIAFWSGLLFLPV